MLFLVRFLAWAFDKLHAFWEWMHGFELSRAVKADAKHSLSLPVTLFALLFAQSGGLMLVERAQPPRASSIIIYVGFSLATLVTLVAFLRQKSTKTKSAYDEATRNIGRVTLEIGIMVAVLTVVFATLDLLPGATPRPEGALEFIRVKEHTFGEEVTPREGIEVQVRMQGGRHPAACMLTVFKDEESLKGWEIQNVVGRIETADESTRPMAWPPSREGGASANNWQLLDISRNQTYVFWVRLKNVNSSVSRNDAMDAIDDDDALWAVVKP